MSLKDMGQVPARDFLSMVQEVDYQRRVEQYPILIGLANIVCVLANTKTSKHRPNEFAGDEPKRRVTKTMVKKDKYEMLLGDGETYTLAILDANMMEAVENEFDKTWNELWQNPRMGIVKALLLQILKPNYPDMTIQQVGKLLNAKTIAPLVAIITGMTNG